jgi:peptide/nickel transport system substrate-binding protein
VNTLLLTLGIVSGLAIFAQPGVPGTNAPVREGGIFRISLAAGSGIDHLDPALAYTPAAWALLDTVCARLLAYPDKPPPAGFRPVPEVATGFPKISRDLRTYTFTLRSGFRFNDGTPVRASAFARAINRMLAPGVASPGVQLVRDIVGAAEVRAGKTPAAAGVVARGNTLVVRFTRPVSDFADRTTTPFFCAVPPTLPADPEGVEEFPGAGPYYVAEYRPGERVVIRRNRFYGGRRPHHVNGFDVDLRASSPQEMLNRVKRGEADWGHTVAGIYFDPSLALVSTYGVNGSRFFVRPGLTLRMLAFNSSRPLFRDNPRLRRAVNYALGRRALQFAGPLSSELTDQYLPSTLPGSEDANIYPLDRPDVEKARELAAGNTRSGKAVMYTTDNPLPLAAAQLVKRQLAEIGLELEVKALPIHIATAAYVGKLAVQGEPWDLALVLWTPNFMDPYAYLNALLDRQFIGGTNLARFESGDYDRLLRQAALVPQAGDRNRAYGALDVRLARGAAPLAALDVLNEVTLVSARVGCIVLRPALDLTAVCLE